MTNLRFKSERFYCLILKILNHFQLVRFPQLEICPRLTKYTKLSDMECKKPVIFTGDIGKPVFRVRPKPENSIVQRELCD